MEHRPKLIHGVSRALIPVYLLGLFFTLHFVFPVYINSTFLATLISEANVGIIYSAASLITLIGILSVTRIVEAVGNYKATLFLLIIEALALLGLAFSEGSFLLLIAFIIHFSLSTIILFNVDIFLERYSKDSSTGGTRGFYLMLLNIAWMIAPAVAGFVLESGAFRHVFLLSLILLIPSFIILITSLSDYKDAHYEHLSVISSCKRLWKNAGIRYIFLANFWLKMFFAWMVIYVPLYLNQHIGIDFKTLGIIFTVMLSAYVILEYPLGKLADTTYGEKEMLTLGFVVIAFATAILSFITSTSIFVWAGLLLLTRIGAAMVEVMSESYFFKKIDSSDTDILSLFRTTVPLGYLIAPLLASIFLSLAEFRYIFIAIAVFTLFGAYFAGEIVDTK